MKRRTLFVIMPFGTRPLDGGRLHDFDAFYQNVLRPIAIAAGWDVLRVDELVAPGTVTHQAMTHLYSSDLVVADVSAPNSNVYFELGARQAMSSGGTILVAVRGTKLPFDISNQRILYYRAEFGNDDAFKRRYKEALRLDPRQLQNPIQIALKELGVSVGPREDRASFEREFDLKIDRARTVEQLVAVWNWARQYAPLPAAGLLSLSARLARVEDYASAAAVLSDAYPTADNDYEVHRQRGFYLRKLGDLEAAEAELRRALELNPNDPQTLGMLGGTLKRQGRSEEALKCYETGARIAPRSLYLRIANAGMTVVTNEGDHEKALALYREIAEWVDKTPSFVGNYWADLVMAETHFALGNLDEAYRAGESAVQNGAHPAEVQSTAEQIQMIGNAGLHMEQAEEFAGWLLTTARSTVSRRPSVEWVPAGRKEPDQRKIIFHISDIHFGSVQGPDGHLIDMHRFIDSENSRRLSLELIDEFQRGLQTAQYKPQDATIVVSGDLTYTGKPEEFELAHDFLVELCDSVQLRRDQVVLVPGNHDVDWTVAQDNLNRRFDNYLAFVQKFYGEDTFRRRFPLISWDLKVMSKRPEANEIIYIREDGPLMFVGLNSCVFEDHQHHYGFIGMRQLDRVRKLLLETAAPHSIRIAVMHHHLHPYPEPLEPARNGADVLLDMSTVRDAGLVEQRLARMGFSLVLHGHKHKAQLRETSVKDVNPNSVHAGRSLIISGCGSTGVSKHELEHNRSNHYAILEMLRTAREPGADFVRVEWRELSLEPGAEWATVERWTVKG